jgi:hypothetical protein
MMGTRFCPHFAVTAHLFRILFRTRRIILIQNLFCTMGQLRGTKLFLKIPGIYQLGGKGPGSGKYTLYTYTLASRAFKGYNKL